MKNLPSQGLKSLLFILCSIVISSSYAQAPDTEGVERKYAKEFSGGFFGEDDNYIYSTRTSSEGPSLHLYVDKYNKKTLTEEWSKEINAADVQKQVKFKLCYFYHSYMVNNRIYCFFQLFDNKKDTMYYMLQTLEPNGELSPVYALYKNPTRSSYDGHILSISPDKKYFAFCPFSCGLTREYLPLAGDSKVFRFSDLSEVWSKSVKDVSGSGTWYLRDMKVDNNGKLFFKGNSGELWNLFVVDQSSPTVKTFQDLFPKKLRSEEYSWKFTSSNDLLIGYMKGDDKFDMNGQYENTAFNVIVMDVDLLKIKWNQAYPIDKSIFSKIQKNERKKEICKERPLTHVSWTAPDLSEYASGFFVTSQLWFYSCEKDQTYVKDYITLNVEKDGKFLNTTILPWYRTTAARIEKTEYIQEGFSVYDNKLQVVYPESPKNAAKKAGTYSSLSMEEAERTEYNVVLFSLDAKGELQKRILHTNDRSTFQFDLMSNLYQLPRFWISKEGKIIVQLDYKKANLEKYASFKLDKK